MRWGASLKWVPEKYVRDWRNWVAPAAIAGTLIVAVFLAFLVVMILEVMGNKANEIDDSRAMSAAHTALTAVRRRLSGTLESVEDRLIVLEKIITDRGYDLANQIEALRDRPSVRERVESRATEREV